MALEITDAKVADSLMLPKWVDKSSKKVNRVLADGGYDKGPCRKHLLKRGIEGCIPPRRKGRQREEEEFYERNGDLKVIQALGGDEEAFNLWKMLVGYHHKRSLVETAFFPVKASIWRQIE